MDGFEIHDPRFAHLIVANAPLQTLASGFRWIEGPVWIADANCLLFQDLPSDRTMRWVEDGGVSIFRSPSAFANGQARDLEGRLISCSHRERCVFRTEHDGRVVRLVDSFEGKRLNSPNDVVVKSDGSIWFTDPLYGIQSDYEGGRQSSERPPAVFRFDPGRNALAIVADDFDGPNGLAFSPDESRLYIAETGDQTTDEPKQLIRSFDVEADGSLRGDDVFHKVSPGYTDGMRVDEYGNVWASAADGVHCIDPDGRALGTILVPYRVSNVAFGGQRNNRLFIGGSHTLYSIFLNCRGATWP